MCCSVFERICSDTITMNNRISLIVINEKWHSKQSKRQKPRNTQAGLFFRTTEIQQK